MNNVEDKYFSGQGNLSIGRIGTDGKPLGLRQLGNVPELKISIAVTNVEHKESRTGQRSIDKRLATETKVGVSFTLENFSKENLALVQRGTISEVAAGTATHEATKFYAGASMPLEFIKVSAVVVETASVALVPYVDDETDYDYRVDSETGMLYFAPATDLATGTLADGDALTVSYTYAKQVAIESLTAASFDYYLRFDGLNTADENSPVVVEVFRFSGDPLKELSLISDTINSFALEGNAYPSSKRPAGKSPYYSIKKV